jgi:putative ATP-dependent endonuclease of OLD family
MYLKKLQIEGFRCIGDLTLDFHKGMNILIGENDTGKTTVLDALRICLGIGAERREVYITPDDFHVNESGQIASSIEFHLVFDDLNLREQGIFYELLATPERTRCELQLHVRFTYDEIRDRIQREYWGGENKGQGIPSEVLGLIYFIHLDALRDASRDLTPRRGNQLSKLFLKLVPGQDEREEYEKAVNDQIRSVPKLRTLLEDGQRKINAHLNKVSFRDSSQSVDIDLVDTKFRDIVEGFRVRIPREVPLKNHEEESLSDELVQAFKIWQNGLGSNNIIYIATVLGDLFERRDCEPDSFISLLIEEPEAHLHPQLQNVLFTYLKEIENRNIQVFVTSHSPTITAKTNLDSVIVLTKNGGIIASTPLRKISLDDKHKKYLQRFLDVTKSQIFFAKAVILVEGISEALLLPTFARRMEKDYDLERAGVEIANIDGVAFEPFARLFNSDNERDRLNIRCAILTDDDRSMQTANNAEEISSRASKAIELRGGLLAAPFLARSTFEYELFHANEDLVLQAYSELHSRTDLSFDGEIHERAQAFADKVKANKDKAIFAQLLAQKIEEEEAYRTFVVPNYIQHAIKWVVDGSDERTNT